MVFYIQCVETGKYLDIKDGKKDQGAEVITYNFNGQENQQWRYKSGTIISQLSGYVLDVSGGEENGKLIVWKKNGNDNQKWFFDDDFTMRSGMGTVLNVSGSTLSVHAKNGGKNQKFRVVPVDESQ